MLENVFKTVLSKELKRLFPHSIIMHTNPNEIQGIPDLLILNGDRWAALEVKRSINESVRPNQEYYVNLMNAMSYAAFIYPENMKVVLNELQQALRVI